MKLMSTILWISLSIIVIFGLINRNAIFKTFKKQNSSQVNIGTDTNDILTPSEFKVKIDKLGLGKHWDKFKPLLRNEIRVITSKSDTINKNPGKSKIGGQPDLPKGINWFKENNDKSLSFIAQININEIKVLIKIIYCPIVVSYISFYSAEQEAWGFDPKDVR